MVAKFICVLAIAGAALAYVPAKRSADVASSASSFLDIQAQISAAVSSSDHSSCLGLLGLGNVKEKLEQIDYKNITEVEEVPAPTSISLLLPLLDLKESASHARVRLVATLSTLLNITVDASLSIEEQVQVVIHAAILKAIEATSPVTELIEIVYNIVKIYFDIAVTCPLYIASLPVITEGLQLATSCVSVVIKASVSVQL